MKPLFLSLLLLVPFAAMAEDAPSNCMAAHIPKDAILSHHGTWTGIGHESWLFLRGIYAMSPSTPPGLPYGDEAVLAQVPGDAGGVVFFIDGDLACTPMPVPHELIVMLLNVEAGKIYHEAGAL